MIRISVAIVLLFAGLVSCGAAQEPTTKPSTHPASKPFTMKKANRLAKEKSPYLKQHQFNPVDWWPWCEEAFLEAKKRGQPVFLSIGYSTCHWCHVMEHESFENEEIAAFMNANFVCIKLDREERPDVDAIYMRVIQLLTNRGGWPASLFLTSEKTAFYGGTYYPPETFLSILTQVSDIWKKNPDNFLTDAKNIFERISVTERKVASKGLPSATLIDKLVPFEISKHDKVHGGFGVAPKFPRTSVHEILFRSDSSQAHEAALFSLKNMSKGGIYDHVGGGFHRYSTDRQWLVPHFEKMLYDQALVATTYLEAGLLSGDSYFHEVARDTLDCILRDFAAPEGGLYCAYDADSGGVEGSYYVWTKEELDTLFKGKKRELLTARFRITKAGNWSEENLKNVNILTIKGSWAEVAASIKLTVAETQALWAETRETMREVRDQRARPGLDNKILTGWTGLGITALAKGGRLLNEPRFVAQAEKAAHFILNNLKQDDGRTLFRRWCDGEKAFHGTLQDYAYFGLSLIDLFEATGEASWIQAAVEVADSMLAQCEAKNGALYDSPDVKDLIVRLQDPYDGARPSSNARACRFLLRLEDLTSKKKYGVVADGIMRVFKESLDRGPWYYPELMKSVLARSQGMREIVVIGDEDHESTKAMKALLNRSWLPATSFCFMDEAAAKKSAELIPLLKQKVSNGGAAVAYVCRQGVCQLPAKSLAELKDRLAERKQAPQDN